MQNGELKVNLYYVDLINKNLGQAHILKKNDIVDGLYIYKMRTFETEGSKLRRLHDH